MTQEQIERRKELFSNEGRLIRSVMIAGGRAHLEEQLAKIIVQQTKFFPETGEVRIADPEELGKAFAKSTLVQQMAAVLVHSFEEQWIEAEAKRTAEEATAILNSQYRVIYAEIEKQNAG